MGTASLVLGVLALALAVLVVFSPLAVPLGLVAIVLGAVGMNRAGRGEANNRGSAVAGLVTGALAIVVVLVLGVTFMTSYITHQDDLRRFGTCISGADDDDARAECVRELGDRLEDND